MLSRSSRLLLSDVLKALAILSLFALASPTHGTENTIEKPESPIARGTDGKTISIDGEPYHLVWSDEFSGDELDKRKWAQRILGYGYAGQYCTDQCAYVDGKGHLVLAMCALPKSKVRQELNTQEQIDKLEENEEASVPTTSHLRTNVDFLYGYHEIRFKLPNIPGPGLTFWFSAGKKGPGEAEIDVLEGCLYNKREKFCDYKSSSIHWYSQNPEQLHKDRANCRSFHLERRYSPEVLNEIVQNAKTELEEHEKLKTRRIDRSKDGLIRLYTVKEDLYFRWDDQDWHTVSLLWTEKEYVFYYDGIEVGRYDKGIRTVPTYAILWLRNWGNLKTLSQKAGCDDPRQTPARIG